MLNLKRLRFLYVVAKCIIWLVLQVFSPSTGCSDWKLSKVNGCRNETVHFWLYVLKAKIGLRGGRFFSIFKNLFTIVRCLFTIFKKCTAFQTHFGLSNLGSKLNGFSSTAIYFWKFSIRSSDSEHPVDITLLKISLQNSNPKLYYSCFPIAKTSL